MKLKPYLTNKPVLKGFYAWTSLHAGSFLLFVRTLKHHHEFIFLPGPSYMNLTDDDFDTCIKNKILEFVEVIPDDVYEETIQLAKNNVALSSNLVETNNDEKNTTIP